MKISRFYQPEKMSVNEKLTLSTLNHKHAVQVLRLKVNELLILFNGEGGEYLARMCEIDRKNSEVLIESFDSVNRESSLDVTLAIAMIKPEKMDFAIQKAVELGVGSIQLIYTNRSVIKIKSNRLEKKMQHWLGVIHSACEQSGRTAVPTISAPVDLSSWLDSLTSEYPASLNITMLPGEYPTIAELKGADRPASVSLLVGPEGGFTEEEEQQMLDANLSAIRFGPRILRAETAAIAGIAACQLRWGDM